MRNEKGFTLIELLAVVVIMGILMAVAIPSINLIITDSRKDIYINSAKTFINEAEKEVINSTFEIDDPDTTYYIHIANLVDDDTNLGKSGFATWADSYVVATMDLINNKETHNYYFNSSDMANWKVTLIGRDKLKKSNVYQDKNRKVNFMPVGNRKKIVVYDANGIKDDTKKPFVSLSEEKATKCYEYKSLSETTVSITKYKPGCGANVSIPNVIGDKTVTTIDQWAFSNKGVESLYIPDGVKTISYGAFYNNNLTTLNVPSSVEAIGGLAFMRNKIAKLSLPVSLKSIGGEGFRNNELTDSIEVLVPGPTTIGIYAFRDNKIPVSESFVYKRNSNKTIDYTTLLGFAGDISAFSNNTFTIPAQRKGVSLLKIADQAFNGYSALKNWNVIIPDSVTSIGQWAFSNTGISSVTLPKNIKTIGYGSFYNNNLTFVSVADGAEAIGGLAFKANKISKLRLPTSLKTIGSEAFRNNELTDSIEDLVPGPNTTIGQYAFSDNKIPASKSFVYLRNADGSMNYTTIKGYMGKMSDFENNTLIIPGENKGVKLLKIADQAFNGYSILKNWKVVIPDSVTSIGQWAFSNTGISSVTLPKNIKTIGYGSFYNNNLTSINVANGAETIGGLAFKANKISKLRLPTSLKTIGSEAFRNNELTDSIEDLVPGPNTTIGQYAFSDNKIPVKDAFIYKRNADGTMDYTTLIGYMGSLNDFSNKKFVIPEKKKGVSLLKIADQAFNGYSILKNWNVVIPDTVTSIGQWAFGSTGISSVTLPKNIKTIGYGSFYNNNLTSINVANGAETIGGLAFKANKISKLRLPTSLKTIGSEAFRNNELTDSIEDLVPGPNTTIGQYAFSDNKIPVKDAFIYKRNADGTMDYTTLIGYMGSLNDFSNKKFVIPEKKKGVSLLKIADQAFNGYSILKNWNVVIPDTVTSIGQWAFGSTGISSVTLPKNIKTIGYGSFYNNNLTSITIPSEVNKINGIAFSNNQKLTKIINQTGKSFNWKDIVGGTTAATFETGTVKTSHGDIIVTNK